MKTLLDDISLKVSKLEPSKLPVGCLALFVNPEGRLLKNASLVDQKYEGAIQSQIASLGLDFKQDKSAQIGAPAKAFSQILVVASDAQSDGDRKSAQALEEGVLLSKHCQHKNVETLVVVLEEASGDERMYKTIEGVLLGTYFYQKPGKAAADKKKKRLSSIVFLIPEAQVTAVQKQMETLRSKVKAVLLTRDLVNHPANRINPTTMAKMASDVAKTQGLKIKVFESTDLKKHNMNLITAVGMGSAQTPRLVHLEYEPKHKAKRTIALVGKGVTFDSGGLSLKPQANMYGMKGDMAGAAALLGIASVIRDLSVPVRVHFIFPLVENIPSDRSVKPGDVFTAYNGKSVEIENTDAEGRLILADAIAYAETLKVDQIIDVATLTGAVLVALGDDIAGMMGTSQTMMDQIKASGIETGEAYWQLPLEKSYAKQLKSDVADLKNVGSGRSAGCIIGGLFLSEFVEKTPWVHLDIAGPAYYDKDTLLLPRGGTGFSVRSLIHYLQSVS